MKRKTQTTPFPLKNRLAVAALLVVALAAEAGVVGPPEAIDFDLQGFVDARLKAGERRVVVPPGRYRVAPKNGVHLRLKDLADVELIADGVEIVCANTSRVVVFENCRNLRIKGLTVDFDPLPFTQGRIVAMAPDKKWVEFEILEGYPENELEERIEIFDPATGELRRETAGWEDRIEPLGNHRYRATKRKSYRYREDWDTERVGDILVTNNRFPNRASGHAFSAEKCTQLTIEEVTLYAASTFGFVEHRCDGTTYLRCKIGRRKLESDPIHRVVPRMRSLNADAFHSTEAGKGPAIIGCSAKFQGDDCVNIHGSYHLVTACEGSQLRMAVLRHNTIEPGDPVEFLPFSGPRPPDAVAVKVEPDAPVTEPEKEFIRKLSLLDRHKERLLGGQAAFFKLTLDRAVPLAMGSAVCSGNRVGNGFLVKDCDFGHNRSRGILIKGSRGKVIGNKISHGWMAAVLVAPEFWWMEAASSSDVEIRDNVIVGCRRPAIEIIAPGGNGKPLPSGAHRNIVIAGNKIAESAWPNIHATSTERLAIQGNHLTPAAPRAFVPPLARPWTWGTNIPSPIVTELCEGAVVESPPTAGQPAPSVTLESRGLPRILFNNDSDDLKWPAYPEHHASGLWVPAGKYLPLPKINSLEDALAPRIGPLAKTRTQGLSYCGNFGVRVWDLKRDHIAALGDDSLQPILQFWKRDRRTFLFSMRMNDVHHGWLNWPHLWDDFRRTHRHLFLKPPTDKEWETELLPWIEGKAKQPAISTSSVAFDYSRAEVRTYYLDTLREACRRYDLDGVELDWLRYPDLFRDGEVNVATMTAFVRDARAVLDEAAKRRGHPLRLVARVPVTPEKAIVIGLDVEAWLKAGWLDAVIAGPGTSFSSCPLERWVALAHRHGVPVYGSLERQNRNNVPRYGSPETLRAAIATLWHKGADGLYFFNFYFRDEMPLLDEFADRARLARLPKEYFLESGGDKDLTKSGGPLPLKIAPATAATVSLLIADNPARAKETSLELVWQGKGEFDPPCIKINGHDLTGLKMERSKTACVVSSSSPELKKMLRLGQNQFTLTVSNPATLTALSVGIVP